MANAGQALPGLKTYAFYPSAAFSGFAVVVSLIQIWGANTCNTTQASPLPGILDCASKICTI